MAALSPHFLAQVYRSSAQAVLPQHEIRYSGSGEEDVSCLQCQFGWAVYNSGT